MFPEAENMIICKSLARTPSDQDSIRSEESIRINFGANEERVRSPSNSKITRRGGCALKKFFARVGHIFDFRLSEPSRVSSLDFQWSRLDSTSFRIWNFLPRPTTQPRPLLSIAMAFPLSRRLASFLAKRNETNHRCESSALTSPVIYC